MKNEWKQLCKENNTRQSRLREKDQDVLDDVLSYLKSTNRNPYDLEVLRKDLIGMAEEAQDRGESLEDVIGPDRKDFCEGLAETLRPSTMADWVVFNAPNALFGAWLALSFSLSKDRFGIEFGSTPGMALLLLVIYFWLVTMMYQRTRFRYQSGQPNYKALGLSVLLFLPIAGIAYWYAKMGSAVWFTLPWPVVVAGGVGIWIAAVWYRNQRVAQLSEQNPWKDAASEIGKAD